MSGPMVFEVDLPNGHWKLEETIGKSSGQPLFTLHYMAPEDSWAYGVWEPVCSRYDRAELEAFPHDPPDWWGPTTDDKEE